MLGKRKKDKSQEKSYEELGKMLVNIYESGYINRNQAYKMSFLKGLLSGLGGVIGATIVVGILVWLLSLFGNVNLLKPFVDPLKDKIETRQ